VTNILVTGASGFIGRSLVRALASPGYNVRAAVRRQMPFPERVEVVIVPDFRNSVDWAPVLDGIDVIIHAAGLAHADRAFGDFDRINWKATDELARAAAASKINRLIYISSVRAQAGPWADCIITEQDAPQPTDPYGRSKLAAELAIGAAGVPFTILRAVTVYGPHPKGNIRSLLQLASLPLPLPLAGFKSRRSLLAMDNLISAILFVMNDGATIGETYLVADQTALRIADIIAQLRVTMGNRAPLINVPTSLIRFALGSIGRNRLYDRIGKQLLVSTSKIQSAGWCPKVNPYDGLGAMCRLNGDALSASGRRRQLGSKRGFSQ
jgi:nucleoside-diphosphate-sugar epimerase